MSLFSTKKCLNIITNYGKENGLASLCITLHKDYGVKNIYEFYKQKGFESGGRLLLRRPRYVYSCTNLQYGAGGVVIDTNEWKYLSFPVKTLYSNINYKRLFNNFKMYNVFEATDGTIVTLYYVKCQEDSSNDESKTSVDQKISGHWVLSTNNSYDMNNIKRCGINFKDAFYESVSKSKQSLDDLDTNKCYSFGFRHKDLHYADEKVAGLSEYDVWYVQSVDMKKFNEGKFIVDSVTPPKGIRPQKIIEPSDAVGLLKNKRVSGIGYIIRIKDKYYKNPGYKFAIFFKEGNFAKTLKTCIYNVHDYSVNRNEHVLLWNAINTIRTEIIKTNLPKLIDGVTSYKTKLETLVTVAARYYDDCHSTKENDWCDVEAKNADEICFTVIGDKIEPTPEFLKLLKYVNVNNNNMNFEKLCQFMYMNIIKDEQFQNLCKLYDKSSCIKKCE